MRKSILALLLVFSMVLPMTAGAEALPEDNYRNFYEIFVYSFRDSDGDGYGDLNGVTEKLDYIRDMGYTGIWLMPINPSLSYHKYDVMDYYDVDPLYGTLEDFENLTQQAHERGIKVIIDLVVNHSSSEHPWFKSAIQSAWDGDTEGEYYEYYNFSDTTKDGYSLYNGVYYESRFVYTMPDLNLDSEKVRQEIRNIMAFWLDKGADGFRVDACTSFYTGDHGKNAAFCNWLVSELKSLNPDAFMVGEVWEGRTIISGYYETAPEMSFFDFPTSQQDGTIAQCFTASRKADAYWTCLTKSYESANSGASIPAPFLDNHDTGRIAGSLARKADRIKFAYGLMAMMNGSIFTYYGDEIGMVGSGEDPNKRIAMRWDNEGELTRTPPGATATGYVFDGVAEQQADEDSILNYYRRANELRNTFPAIARGSMRRPPSTDPDVLIYTRSWNDETTWFVINFSTEEKTVDAKFKWGQLQAELAVSGHVTQTETGLTMPGYSIAILQ